MKWSEEKSDRFHEKLEMGCDVMVKSADWKKLRDWHRQMMSRIPAGELHPWLWLGGLFMSIEQANGEES